MQLPLVPRWIPSWLVVANTLVLEAALAVAFYLLVVRRARNRRRATALFVLGALALGAAHGVAAYDVAGPRTNHDRWFKHWEEPAYVLVHFHWQRTPFGRTVNEEVVVIDRNSKKYLVENPELFDRLWPFHAVKPTRETQRALYETLSGSRDAPVLP